MVCARARCGGHDPHKPLSILLFVVCPGSPSGCTFWGKKPWSRKKKLLWQLGTLVGAPVGIALVAGIAVPAMIIGKTPATNDPVAHAHTHERTHQPPVSVFIEQFSN